MDDRDILNALWFALTPESKNHSNHIKILKCTTSIILAKFSRRGEDPKHLASKDLPFKP